MDGKKAERRKQALYVKSLERVLDTARRTTAELHRSKLDTMSALQLAEFMLRLVKEGRDHQVE